MTKIKAAIILVWCLSAGMMFLFYVSPKTIGQKAEPTVIMPRQKISPDHEAVDRFDAALQDRFLNAPGFGMARMDPMEPVPLKSTHMSSFSPRNEIELSAVKAFDDAGWNVGIFLYGWRAYPDPKKPGKFHVNYRLNEPLIITSNFGKTKLPNKKNLVKEVKTAFLHFQQATSIDQKNYEFEQGDWQFIARPVRAINQSCLSCHTDYVITEKTGNKQYMFRERKVGDVNGIMVYAFSRRKASSSGR